MTSIFDNAVKFIYYGAALALFLTVGLLFYSAVEGMLRVAEQGVLETALLVLDRVLLIFIFVELLHTIRVVIQENEIIAEPFLLVGIIAVVRRILLVTAEAEQVVGTPEFQDLVLELGVLTVLVIALAFALYLIRLTRK